MSMTDIRGRLLGWIRTQPNRPFVILYGHIVVVILYLAGRAYSGVPFNSDTTRVVISSPLMPIGHLLAAVGLMVGLTMKRGRGPAAFLSLGMWVFTTGALFFAAENRNPPLSLWGCALASVIAVASFLMLAQWGVDGDESGTL
jgi:hypothetical protein